MAEKCNVSSSKADALNAKILEIYNRNKGTNYETIDSVKAVNKNDWFDLISWSEGFTTIESILESIGLELSVDEITPENFDTYYHITEVVRPNQFVEDVNIDQKENYYIPSAIVDVFSRIVEDEGVMNKFKQIVPSSNLDNNYKKLAFLWIAIEKIHKDFTYEIQDEKFTVPMKESAYKLMSNYESDGYDLNSFKTAYTDLRRSEFNDYADVPDYNAEEISPKNTASIFGVRPFVIPISEFPFGDTTENIEFKSVYQALTAAKYIITKGGYKNAISASNKTFFDNILNTKDSDELYAIYNSISMDDNASKVWNNKETMSKFMTNLAAFSFDDTKTKNPKALISAKKFLNSSQSESFRENDKYLDKMTKLYSDLLPVIKSRFSKQDESLKRVSTISDVTISDIEANPSTLFVISPLSKDYSNIKKKNYKNVVLVDTADISSGRTSDAFIEPPNYTDELVASDDNVVVYDISDVDKVDALTNIGKNLSVESGLSRDGKTYNLSLPNKNDRNDVTSSGIVKTRDKVVDIFRNVITFARELEAKDKDKKVILYLDNLTKATNSGFTGKELIDLFNEAAGASTLPSNMRFSMKWKEFIGKEQYKVDIDSKMSDIVNGNNDVVIDSVFNTPSNKADVYLKNIINKLVGIDNIAADEERRKLYKYFVTRGVDYKDLRNTYNKIIDISLDTIDSSRQNDGILLSDYMKDLLFYSNSYVPITPNNSLSMPFDFAKNFSKVLYGTYQKMVANNKEAISRGWVDGHGNPIDSTITALEGYCDWENKPINSNSLSLLYMPSRNDFDEYNKKSNSKYTFEEALDNAIKNADKIMSAGGAVLTLSYSALNNKYSAASRKEDANKELWNEMLKRGYEPSVTTSGNTKISGITMWTKNINNDKDIQNKIKQLQKTTEKLKEFHPNVTTNVSRGIYDINVIPTNSMYGKLSKQGAEFIKNTGILTFEDSDYLKESVKNEIEKAKVEKPDLPIRVNIVLAKQVFSFYVDDAFDSNGMYTLKVKDNSLFVMDMKGDEEMLKDTSMFSQFSISENNIEITSPKLKLGVEKANIYINSCIDMFANKILKPLVKNEMTSLWNDITTLRKSIVELKDDKNKSDDEKIELLREYNRTLHDNLRKYRKLRNKEYSWLVNSVGMQKLTEQLKRLYAITATLPLEKDVHNATDSAKKAREALCNSIMSSIVVHSPVKYRIKEDKELGISIIITAKKCADKKIIGSREIVDNFDILLPYVLKNLSSRFPVKMYIKSDGKSSSDDIETEDKTMNQTSDSMYEGDEPISSADKEVVFKDNWQAVDEDTAKTVTQEIWTLLRNLPETSRDPETGFYKLNEFGEIQYHDEKETYNFLRHYLQGSGSYEEMERRMKDLVNQGKWEYNILLRMIDRQGIRSLFYSTMYTIALDRLTVKQSDVLNDPKNGNKVIYATKDAKKEHLQQTTLNNLAIKNKMSEKRDLITINEERVFDVASKIKSELIGLREKFRNANYKYEEGVRQDYKNGVDIEESKERNNIFFSTNADDKALCENILETFKDVLQGLGISIDKGRLSQVVKNYESVYKLFDLLISEGDNKGIITNAVNTRKVPNLEYGNDSGNYFYLYKNIFDFLAPAFMDIAQPGTTYLNGKTMSNYELPSFITELIEKLNNDSYDPVTNQRMSQKFIDDTYLDHPYFYKPNNVDEIIESLRNVKGNAELKAKIDSLIESITTSVSDDKIKNVIQAENAENMYRFDDGYYLKFDPKTNNYPKSIIRDKRNKIIRANISQAASLLPNDCPEFKTDIWRCEWLERIYYNKMPLNDSLRKETWGSLKQRLLNDINKKDYRSLTEKEYQQYMLDTYFTVYNQSKGWYGGFFAPIASDKEHALLEVFANVEGSIDKVPNNVAKKIAKVVEAETEMQKAFYNKFIRRLESYNRFNKYRIQQAKLGLKEELKKEDFEGYSEYEQNIDIEEKVVYKTITVEGDDGVKRDVHIIDLGSMKFGEDGTFEDTDSNHNEAKKKIKKWKLKYQYVKYDPSSSKTLLQQVQDELHKQFVAYLESLDRDLVIPTKAGNKRIFKEQNNVMSVMNMFGESNNEDEELDIYDIYDEELEENEDYNNEVKSYEDSIRGVDDEDEEEGYISNFKEIETEDIFKEVNADVLNRLRKYFYNQAYATIQLHMLTSTSPAFFSNPIDYQKRSFEYQTKSRKMDVTSWSVEDRKERCIYLADIFRNALNADIEKIIDQSKNLTEQEKADAKAAFFGKAGDEPMDITDGQAWRTPKSYKKIQEKLGRWSEEKEAAYNRLRNPKEPFNLADVRTLLMGPIKGFYFGMEKLNVTNDYSILKPVQHKDSEAMMIQSIIMERLGEDSVLAGVCKFMEDFNIDLAAYASGVKVGCAGVIDINSAKTASEAYELLRERVFKSDGTENKEVLHEVEWKDYGVVTETPEHFFEEKALMGTQIRRIFFGDYDENASYTIIDPLTNQSTIMKGSEILDKYNNLIFDNLKQDFEELKDLFGSPEKLEDYLLKEVSGNPLYPSDLSDYCKFDRKTGVFTKLVSPKNFKKTQQLLLSLVRNRITAQKIAGGSLTQVSVAYAADGLALKTEKVKDANGVEHISPIEAECLLPVYMEPLFENLLTEEGYIDINKIDEIYKDDEITKNALLKMIGYRIPTEGLSSTLKLKVKGFSAGYDGGSIILPQEIVSLAGSDFDIDKMFIHRFAFKTIYDRTTKTNKVVLLTKENAVTPAEKKDARNNELIKLMMGMMTMPENAMAMVKPQGFRNLEKTSFIMNILQQPDNKYSISELKNMSYDKLKSMTNDQKDYSYLNPATQVYFQQQNMIGKRMLGSWAIAKAAHSLFERAGLTLKQEYRFKYNDMYIQEPDPMKIKSGGIEKILSLELGSYVGAAADNAKNPVLAKLGITTNNIKIAIYLARLGFDSTSIAVLLNNKLFSNIREFDLYISNADEELQKSFRDRNSIYAAADSYYQNSISLEEVRDIVFNDDLVNSIRETDYLDNEHEITVSTISGQTKRYTKGQIAVAIHKLFKEIISKPADQLNDLTTSTRADSLNGTLQAHMSQAVSLIQKIIHSRNSLKNRHSCFIEGKKDFFKVNFNGYGEYNDPKSSTSGYVQAFMDFGVLGIIDLFKDKMPHFSATFSKAFEIGFETKKGYISELGASLLESALFKFHLSHLPIFASQYVKTENGTKFMTFNEIQEYYKTHMVALYYQMKNKYPDIFEKNSFIQALQPSRPLTTSEEKEGKVRYLRLPNANQLLETTKIQLQDAFLQLFEPSQPSEVREFGWHLFKYSFYRQGISYLPDGYGHLIPNEIWDSLDGYEELCNRLFDDNEQTALSNGAFIENFIDNCEVFAKELYTVPYSLFKEAEDHNRTDELNNQIEEEVGFLPRYITVNYYDKDLGKKVYIPMRLRSDFRYGTCCHNKEKHVVTTTQFMPYTINREEPFVPSLNAEDKDLEAYNRAIHNAYQQGTLYALSASSINKDISDDTGFKAALQQDSTVKTNGGVIEENMEKAENGKLNQNPKNC